MTITVEEIRERYPNPRKNPTSSNGYCVGYALCRYLKRPLSIFEALMWANPGLSERKAKEFHRHIVETNDAGDFDAAWAWLGKGLSA
jgi:hypothetical protein